MEINSTAKVAFTKRELLSLIEVVEEKQRYYEGIDYEQLDDDEAGEVGDEHEVNDGILAMLKAAYTSAFG